MTSQPTNLKHLVETATRPEGTWKSNELAQFHYNNPNGAMAQFVKMCNVLDGFIAANSVPVDRRFTIGHLNHATYGVIMNIRNATSPHSVVSPERLAGLVRLLEEQTEKGYLALAEELMQE